MTAFRSSNLSYCFNREPGCARKTHYHANLAKNLPGYLLTRNFRPSSNSNRPMPNAIGRNQCSTGTVVVSSTVWNFGT